MSDQVLLYFGDRWDAPLFDDIDATQVDTPVGVKCSLCAETVIDGDCGFLRAHIAADHAWEYRPQHRECELANVVGALAHVQGRCRYVGHCNELMAAEGRSRREDALAVWAHVRGGLGL